MSIRLAILGLDPIQREWLEAVSVLAAANEIEVVGIAHRTPAGAKDVASLLKTISSGTAGGAGAGNATAGSPTFDDLRLLLKSAAPQVILMDRPANVSIDFLLACAAEQVAIFSLGPPVQTLAEALALGAALEPRSRLLYIWPCFADEPVSRHCAQADHFVRPIRFAAASWMGFNHALAKGRSGAGGGGAAAGSAGEPTASLKDMPVRSLSVLAWDALATLIRLMDMPTSVYAAIRGTVGSGDTFNDLSGAASLTLRFPDDASASMMVCDRLPPADGRDTGFGREGSRRELLLWGAGGTVRQNGESYEFRDAEGRLIDAGPTGKEVAETKPLAARTGAIEALREFLRHYTLPPSPHRGWEHRLEAIAATIEALVVSHRTGQAESPERFQQLRR